jgi:MFS family permease
MNGLLIGVVPLPIGYWVVVFTLPNVLVGVFVRATRRRDREREQDRRAGLGCAAFLGGPLIGVLLAALATHLGDVHPLDVHYTYSVLISMGAIAGFVIGCAFALTSLFAPREARAKESRTKSVQPWDEL